MYLDADLVRFHRKGRMRFFALNLTGGNLEVSGTVQQGSVPWAWRFTEHSCKISGQVIVTAVLRMEYHKTL